MATSQTPMSVIADELDLLRSFCALRDADIIELGCGKAELARRLVATCPGCTVAALEVDERQHAKNLQQPLSGLTFVHAGAEEIPFESGRFDLALMLKSLHHVAVARMDAALEETRRILKTGGLLYVSEPVFAGDLNEIIRLFHDEQQVREAARLAIRRALESGAWSGVGETLFDAPVAFRDFDDFEQRIVNVTFADHRLGDSMRDAVRRRFEAHMGAHGAHFLRPMRVDVLRKLR